MQKHNGEGDIRILCKHHSRADARNSYEVGSWLERNMTADSSYWLKPNVASAILASRHQSPLLVGCIRLAKLNRNPMLLMG